jgi:hypothetical protein
MLTIPEGSTSTDPKPPSQHFECAYPDRGFAVTYKINIGAPPAGSPSAGGQSVASSAISVADALDAKCEETVK